MIIAGIEKVINAMSETDIVEVSKDYNVNIEFIKIDTLYEKPYILYTKSEQDYINDILYNTSDYDTIEKIIYDGYTEEDMKDYNDHWYDEIEKYRISNEIKKCILDNPDNGMLHKCIKTIETETHNIWNSYNL